ncbi:MAG TPA: methyl-accepting chemotaxis protein, partial [Nocardioides sp.]|nr:methyl-accepting chemotaxis protein [Nocardioides sp.]
EAARAGRAGAGFAVVAAEVKDLARQTGEATQDIARRIEGIQADVGQASVAMASISEVVDQVDRMSSTMSSAVEEHSATSAVMTRSMTEAAAGSEEITRTITRVAEGASDTAAAAGTVREASVELGGVATALVDSIAHFTVDEDAGGDGGAAR